MDALTARIAARDDGPARALVSLDAKGCTGFVNGSAASSGIVAGNTVGETHTSSTETDFSAFAKMMAIQSMLPSMPIFDGDPAEWPMFHAEFQRRVHQPYYDDAQRMAILRTCL